jgi:hypothetical protein
MSWIWMFPISLPDTGTLQMMFLNTSYIERLKDLLKFFNIPTPYPLLDRRRSYSCMQCSVPGPRDPMFLDLPDSWVRSVPKGHGSGALRVWENFNIFYFLFSSSDSQCLRGTENRGAGEYGAQYRWNHQVTLRPESGSSEILYQKYWIRILPLNKEGSEPGGQWCESEFAWIQTGFGRLNLEPNPRGQKWPTKVGKSEKIQVLKCWMFSFEGYRLLL